MAGLVIATGQLAFDGGSGSADAHPLAPMLRTPGAHGIADHYIVVLAPASTNTQVRSVSEAAVAAGGTLRFTYQAALKGFSAMLPPAALAAVRASSGVSYVEQDAWATVPRGESVGRDRSAPAAAETNAIWNLGRIDQRDLPLDDTYSYRATGAGVTAYVLDTGVWFRHPEFQDRARSGYDFVDDDRNAIDCNGHGTHVAGTISGKKYGVAKEVEVVAVRVLGCDGRGPFSQVIAGVDWVTSHSAGPAVANMSIGGKPNRAVDQAVTTSIDSGIPYAIAAGNDSADACDYSPARTKEALTVGATDKTDKQASFSNVGRCLDLYAPGVLIRSAWPSDTGITNTISGTSFAAPHVAGTVALYLELHPAATPSRVRHAVVGDATAGRLSNLGPDSPNRLVYSRAG